MLRRDVISPRLHTPDVQNLHRRKPVIFLFLFVCLFRKTHEIFLGPFSFSSKSERGDLKNFLLGSYCVFKIVLGGIGSFASLKRGVEGRREIREREEKEGREEEERERRGWKRTYEYIYL